MAINMRDLENEIKVLTSKCIELDRALELACGERATISGSAKLFYEHFRAAARAELSIYQDLH